MSNETFFHRVKAQTPTRFWINNVTEGEAHTAIGFGAVGCTQNPSYTHKMLIHPNNAARSHTRRLLKECVRRHDDDNEVEIALQKRLVCEIAAIFMPLYTRSGGTEGFVSIQGDPIDESSETITRLARFNREGAPPNIMAKIPGTQEGLVSIEALMREGVPLNITEVFALAQVKAICDLYTKLESEEVNLPPVYISHITGIYDEYMTKWAKEHNAAISSDYLYQAGIIAAKKTYRYMQQHAPKIGFIGGGARGLQHFTEMIGAKANITINWLGTADKLVEQNPPVLEHFHRPVDSLVVDELIAKVPSFRQGYLVDGLEPSEFEEFGPVELFRDSFVNSWKEARDIIANCPR